MFTLFSKSVDMMSYSAMILMQQIHQHYLEPFHHSKEIPLLKCTALK